VKCSYGKISAKCSYGNRSVNCSFSNISVKCSYSNIYVKCSYGNISVKSSYSNISAKRSYRNISVKCSYHSISVKCSYRKISIKCSHGNISVKCSYLDMSVKCSYLNISIKCSYVTTADPCYRGTFLFLKPSLSDVSNIYTLPFSSAVWLTYFLTTAVLCCALHVVQRKEGNIGDSAPTQPMSLSDSVLNVIGIVCQEGLSYTFCCLLGVWVAIITSLGVAALLLKALRHEVGFVEIRCAWKLRLANSIYCLKT